ncbi:MAG: serine/threonine-protein kinase [Gemmatimonadota bacterium]
MPDDSIERLNQALSDRYVVEGEVGEGGMATVYVAQDLKHNRRVALKVLKPELSAVVGAERFLTEIETTANLQHPHILPLFDSGEAEGVLFYVMPYVEGETLREKLEREKQLSIAEGVRIAKAVGGALDYAHRHGVVHRDIKPANILLHDGEPVVSDFGIALAVGAGGARLTETGLSVGTPYYMSPEQATGDQQVGPASDIYSLACVLYEMLVGEPPYPGNTAQAVLGKIIQGDPVSAMSVRRSVPAHVDAAIRKALEKLPADRFTNAQDFTRALEDPSFRHGVGATADTAVSNEGWKRATVGLAAATVVLGAGLLWSAFGRSVAPPEVQRYASPFLQDQEPDNLIVEFFGLAPDGSLLVYRSGSALWVRRWRDLEAVPVRGAAGGWSPSVSPEGDAVSFWTAEREIKVASLEGGPLQNVLTDVGGFQHWGADGFIYAYARGDGEDFVVRAPAAGGAVDTLWSEPEGEQHYVTDILPGGRQAAVFVVFPDGDGAFPEVRFVDLESGESKVVTTGTLPHYLPSGDLAYLAPDSSLMVAPVDLEAGELTGPPIPMLEGVTAFAIARDGTLFYTGGSATDQEFELIWVSKTGVAEPVQPGWTFDPDIDNRGWEISPDGSRIALKARTDLGNDIWVKELPEGPMTPGDGGHDRCSVDTRRQHAGDPEHGAHGRCRSKGHQHAATRYGLRTAAAPRRRLRRVRSGGLSRWPLACVHLGRDRQIRGLRASLPQRERREGPGLGRRRSRRRLVPRRPRDLLRDGRPHDGRRPSVHGGGAAPGSAHGRPRPAGPLRRAQQRLLRQLHHLGGHHARR